MHVSTATVVVRMLGVVQYECRTAYIAKNSSPEIIMHTKLLTLECQDRLSSMLFAWVFPVQGVIVTPLLP